MGRYVIQSGAEDPKREPASAACSLSLGNVNASLLGFAHARISQCTLHCHRMNTGCRMELGEFEIIFPNQYAFTFSITIMKLMD
jgi:hypothetical protein